MFSKPPNALRRTASFRLTAWYSGVFILSLLVLFAIVDFVLVSSLKKRDRELLNTRLHTLMDQYRQTGLSEIKRVSLDKHMSSFFVRFADEQNRTLFASVPEEVTTEVLSRLEMPANLGKKWIEIPLKSGGVLEIDGSPLRDSHYLQIGESSHDRELFLEHFHRVCIAILAPMLALGISGGAFLAHRALRPIRQLNQTVRTIIETGKIDARIAPGKTAGELEDLVLSFNQMLERIDALIESMRGVLDNVAHDLRTPLTRLRGIAEMALQNPLDAHTSQEALADCVEESERVITMLNTLMDISEVETGAMKLHLKPVKVAAVVSQLLDLYRHVADEKQIEITTEMPKDLMLLADENRIRQAAGNLIDNALKYTSEGGTIRVEARHENGEVAFSVLDTGIGIPSEETPKVWERLFRGDKSRSQRGLGLGLSLVKAIVLAHAGRVALDSKPGAGSRFTLYFPAAAA